jgi:hypothetical protein
MNSREKLLAIILILLMAGAAGGAVFWQFIWTPYKRYDQDLAKVQKEIGDLEIEKEKTLTTVHNFDTKTKKKSLPAHIDLAKREYSRLLINMLRKADFDSTDLKVTAREPNTTQVPTMAPKKYAYTKLEFEVVTKGDLTSVIDFLYHFYRQPLLHQITRLSIVKPAGQRGRAGDLDVTMLVQAIALDKAEDRGVLLATVPPVTLLAGSVGSSAYNRRNVDNGLGSPFVSADVLARVSKETLYQNQNPSGKRQPEDPWLLEYRRIAGKNIFYPPNPVVKKDRDDNGERTPKQKDPDFSPFVALIQISHNDDGSAVAVIFDRFNKHYYEIEQDPKGNMRTSKFWYATREEQGIVLEIKKRVEEYDSLYFTIGSEETSNERAFRVRRLLESDVIIEPFISGRGGLMRGPVTALLGGTAIAALPGTLYSWHIGQTLKSEEEGHAPVLLSQSAGRYAMLRPLNFNGNVPPPPVDDPRKKDTKKRPGL